MDSRKMEGPQPLSVDVLHQFPKVDEKLLDEMLSKEMEDIRYKIVVLDDDPTGVQTVHGVSVYTEWSMDSIRSGFAESNQLFFILTNSRSFTEDQTIRCHKEIIERVEAASRETGIRYMIVSRGDSTLRGHYPLETELLREGFEADGTKKADGEIICPFFKEGGRFTIGDVHYVRQGEQLIPAAETEFAKDKTFGYHSSNLREYVAEKTRGVYRAADVISITLEELRALDFDGITEKLLRVQGFGKIVVNAIDQCDLKVFVICLYKAMKEGKNYIFRCAAALVKALGNIKDRSLLAHDELIPVAGNRGGLVVVGSHTKKTTAQLQRLRTIDELVFYEFNSDLVLHEEQFAKEVERTLQFEKQAISEGKTVVVYTRRKLLAVPGDTKEQALIRSVKISEAVQSLVGRLDVSPAFIVAKGGITSSDIGTKALCVKRAEVMGQIRPGIPVWKTGEESRFPGIPYIIFPGNVGEDETLKEAVEVLLGN